MYYSTRAGIPGPGILPVSREVEQLVNFFATLHRSIFEPQFYREVLVLPRKAIFRYCLWLLILFSIITSFAHTWYLIGGRRGIPEGLAAAFPGMEIRGGTLYSPVNEPYFPPSYLIAPLFNQLIGLPALFNSEADSIVLVDTSDKPRTRLKVPLIVLKAKTIEVILGGGTAMEFTYEHILFGAKDLIFTADNIRRFLLSRAGGIFMGYLFSTFLHQGVLVLFSIFFLSAAAYIFRVDRVQTFGQYVRTASFAVSPIVVGSTLVAISGVKIAWMLHFLIFLSTIVMFRAILTVSINNRSSGNSE